MRERPCVRMGWAFCIFNNIVKNIAITWHCKAKKQFVLHDVLVLTPTPPQWLQATRVPPPLNLAWPPTWRFLRLWCWQFCNNNSQVMIPKCNCTHVRWISIPFSVMRIYSSRSTKSTFSSYHYDGLTAECTAVSSAKDIIIFIIHITQVSSSSPLPTPST